MVYTTSTFDVFCFLWCIFYICCTAAYTQCSFRYLYIVIFDVIFHMVYYVMYYTSMSIVVFDIQLHIYILSYLVVHLIPCILSDIMWCIRLYVIVVYDIQAHICGIMWYVIYVLYRCVVVYIYIDVFYGILHISLLYRL